MRKLFLTLIALTFSCIALTSHAGYTQTKYPIVLVHGVTGFDTIGGLINYFHTVPYNLERSGAKVYTASVSAFNSSEERGSQLASYISSLGAEKVNIMAHSQGAPTSRVAASMIPEKIASITSIDGVNYGSRVADVVRGSVEPGSFVEGGVSAIADAIGRLVNLLSNSNNPQSSIEALHTLTTDGTIALNEALDWKGVNRTYCRGSTEDVYIDGHRVKMFSWTGDRVLTNALDFGDVSLLVTSASFSFWEQNDGLVATCSTKMGKVISTSYDMNHVDSVNHMFGARSIWTNPVSLYRSQANRLKKRGL